jgi:uncharacterized protein
MLIERPLLDILACPIDKHGLLLFDDEAILYNPRLRRIYRITGGCPVMLAGRAEPAGEEEHERLLKRARHGEAIGSSGQSAEEIARRVADISLLANYRCQRVVMITCPVPSDTTNSDQYHRTNLYNLPLGRQS